MNWHQFSGDCQVMMAERGEKGHENVVEEDLVVKRTSTSAICTYSGETTCYKHKYCVKHAEQLLQLLEETQPTSITTCNTIMETYTNNSKLTLAIINCVFNNMQTSIFVIAILNSVITHRRFSSYRAGLRSTCIKTTCLWSWKHVESCDDSVWHIYTQRHT